MDPRLERNYSEKSMKQAFRIALSCVAKDPKLRPSMADVLRSMEVAYNHSLGGKEGVSQ